MKLDDVVEEGFGDRRGGVGVAEGNEVRLLGEPVHHSQDDRLAVDPGKSFDEVERDVAPYTRRHRQRLQ
jgi:hypothetical protein